MGLPIASKKMHGGDDGGDSPARPAKRQRPSAPVLDVPAKLKDPKKKKYRDGRLLLDARRLSFRQELAVKHRQRAGQGQRRRGQQRRSGRAASSFAARGGARR